MKAVSKKARLTLVEAEIRKAPRISIEEACKIAGVARATYYRDKSALRSSGQTNAQAWLELERSYKPQVPRGTVRETKHQVARLFRMVFSTGEELETRTEVRKGLVRLGDALAEVVRAHDALSSRTQKTAEAIAAAILRNPDSSLRERIARLRPLASEFTEYSKNDKLNDFRGKGGAGIDARIDRVAAGLVDIYAATLIDSTKSQLYESAVPDAALREFARAAMEHFVPEQKNGLDLLDNALDFALRVRLVE